MSRECARIPTSHLMKAGRWLCAALIALSGTLGTETASPAAATTALRADPTNAAVEHAIVPSHIAATGAVNLPRVTLAGASDIGAAAGAPAHESLAEGQPSRPPKQAATNTGNQSSSSLFAVSATSAADAWAVGSYVGLPSGGSLTLVEHWDGSAWRVVPSPNPNLGPYNSYSLGAVAARAITDAWAVGYYTDSARNNNFTLIEHWDGVAWTVVPSPSLNDSRLNGVSAKSATDAWVVGQYSDTWATKAFIEHWDGTAWSLVPTNVGPGDLDASALTSVASVSATDAWAVGSHNLTSLTEHWDGTAWTPFLTPRVGSWSQVLVGVTATSATDAWAVGRYTDTPRGPNQAFVQRWNGTSWTPVPLQLPSVYSSELISVSANSPTDAWAVGRYASSSTAPQQAFFEHWDGTAWRVIPSPNADASTVFTSVSALSSTDVWAVGSYFDSSWMYHPVTAHWDGTTWQVNTGGGGPIGGSVLPAQTLGNNPLCFACAVGRAVHGIHGDPVDAGTGNFSETSSDITIPGRGFPLQFSRSYNALAANTDGPLGFGWTFNSGMSLTIGPGAGTVTVHQENGSQVPFTLSGMSYTAPPRFIATLVHNADGTYTFARLGQQTYIFDAAGRILTATDLNGYTTTYTYAGNQLVTIKDSASRTLTLGYTGTHLTSVTDANITPARVVTFGYNDGLGNLTDVTDVNGGKTQFTYYPNHLLWTMTDPRGGIVTNHYDSQNRVDWQTDPLGRRTRFDYLGDNTSATGGSTTITDPKLNVTVETYQYGLRTQVTKGSGTPQAATWKYIYDPATLGITSITDPNNHVTSRTYDGSGNVLTFKDALGHQTVNTYNSFNEVLTSTDANGVTTTMTYDLRGNLKTTSTPLVGTGQNRVTTLNYDDPSHPGDVTSMVDPNNKTWTYTYDGNGYRNSQIDPLGHKSSTTYNAIGWKLTSVTPKGNTTNYGYTDAASGLNKFGDVITVTDPLGHVITRHYDANRHVDTLTDPDGNVTRYDFDLANQPTVTTRADGTQLRTTYNPDGTLFQQIDGKGAATTYVYDPLARVRSVTDPLNRVTSATYDGAGNKLTVVDAQSQTTTFTYDAANQLKTITYSDNTTPNVSDLTYDNDGQRRTMTDAVTGTSSWTWDSLHRMTSSTDGAGNTVGYEYDLKGQLTRITYPAKTVVTRTFDDAGHLSAVQDWRGNRTSFDYDADSNLIGQTFPGTPELKDTFDFDAGDRLMGITSRQAGVTYASYAYGRDANNQITSTLSTGVPEPTEKSYTYTSLNQLKTSDGASYSYDEADNVSVLARGATLTYDTANQLNTLVDTSGTTQFTYDLRGNRTQTSPPMGPSSTFTYDQANRLISLGTSPVVTYGYNGDGLRINKTWGSVGSPDYFVEQFTWDVAEGLPLLLTDADVSYVYGPGGLPVEEIRSDGTVLYYHHDQLGSTRLLTDVTGAVAVSYTYDAYGNPTAQIGSDINPFGYAGEYNDTETGLYYLRARYYDPATAQFLTRDPLVARTRSPYGYVVGNPLNRVDPTGALGLVDVINGGLGGALCFGAAVATGATAGTAGLLFATGCGIAAGVLLSAVEEHDLKEAAEAVACEMSDCYERARAAYERWIVICRISAAFESKISQLRKKITEEGPGGSTYAADVSRLRELAKGYWDFARAEYENLARTEYEQRNTSSP